MYNSDLQYIILQKLIQILLYERKKAARNGIGQPIFECCFLGKWHWFVKKRHLLIIKTASCELHLKSCIFAL